MVQRFLLALRSRGGVVSRTIAIATARALIARNSQYNLGHVKIDSSWAQKLFRRIGFKRRMRTTGKVEIPEVARKEAELLYLHDIASIVEKHDIPSHLVMNLHQTSLKYVPAMNHTMAKKNLISVPVIGSSDKRTITGTLIVTLDEQFLPMQLIYGGKRWKDSQIVNFQIHIHRVWTLNVLATPKSLSRWLRRLFYRTLKISARNYKSQIKLLSSSWMYFVVKLQKMSSLYCKNITFYWF